MTPVIRPRLPRAESDDGLGLVEIVIAMLMIAILSVAFLPVLIQGLQTAVVNATRATSAQLAHEQIEIARGKAKADDDCSNFATIDDVALPTVLDERDRTLVITRTAGVCPVGTANYPATVSFAVTVADAETGVRYASAETLVLMGRE